MNQLQNFSKGLIKENPVLVLVLGTCPTLATSTSVSNALGMGAAARLTNRWAYSCRLLLLTVLSWAEPRCSPIRTPF